MTIDEKIKATKELADKYGFNFTFENNRPYLEGVIETEWLKPLSEIWEDVLSNSTLLKIKTTEQKLNLRYVHQETDDEGFVQYWFIGDWLPDLQQRQQVSVKPSTHGFVEINKDCKDEWMEIIAEIWSSN